MAFVRKKKIKGGEYYQLVESRRVDGEPRQKVLLHLGKHPTTEAALKEWPKKIKRLKHLAGKQRQNAETLAANVAEEKKPAWYRRKFEEADVMEKEAKNLEAKLKKLHEFRDSGVA